jgi:receptor-interacting serine/threonine-protein kinase 1
MTVLEICINGSVDDLIYGKGTPAISWREKLALCCGIGNGMAYLHAKGILHRDLKPANILLGDKQIPKIADFGLSRRVDRQSVHALAEKTANIGTPVYMAPELISDNRASEYDGAKVDVFSFGVVMWAIFAQKKPYEKAAKSRGLNLWTLRDMVVSGSRPDMDDEGELDSAPTRAVKLMEQCWAGDPALRPTGFDEIRSRLEKIMLSMDNNSNGTHKSRSSNAMLSAAKVTNMMKVHRNRRGRGRGGAKAPVKEAQPRSSMNPMHNVLSRSNSRNSI